MLIPLEQLLKTLAGEVFARRNIVLIFFVVISLACLYEGTIWPKKYTSFSIIKIDNTNILKPLMRGAAETTDMIDHVVNAREIIFGEKIMEQVLDSVGWSRDDLTGVDIERLKGSIKARVSVTEIGDNLLRISYQDS